MAQWTSPGGLRYLCGCGAIADPIPLHPFLSMAVLTYAHLLAPRVLGQEEEVEGARRHPLAYLTCRQCPKCVFASGATLRAVHEQLALKACLVGLPGVAHPWSISPSQARPSFTTWDPWTS